MGHATYEWIYVGVVIALLTWVGADSWNTEHRLEAIPPQAQTIKAIGQQWFWTFEHANGTQEVGQLHVKAGVPYRFETVSKDVIHSFNIPDFTVLMDAVPGRVNTVWNVFDQPGQYLIQCREYCGLLHYNMRAKLFVEPATAKGYDYAPTSETSPVGGTTTAAGGGSTAATTSQPAALPAGATAITILAGASVQGNPNFSPAEGKVPLGSQVVWENKDTTVHTATSGSGPSDSNSGKAFDTKMINAGSNSAPVEIKNAKVGDTLAYYCQIHPYMTAKLVITAASSKGITTSSPSAATTTKGGGAAASTTATSSPTSAAAVSGPTLIIPQGASVQGNPSYDPAILSVKKGDTIQVQNKDQSPHTVTSGKTLEDPNKGKDFDTSIISPSASAKISTASLKPGQIPFHCDLHPYMTGTLRVQ